MDNKITTSRREALGFASIAVAAITIGTPATAAPAEKTTGGARPTEAELERAKRLYGGEFGGGRGAR
jgi:hypothetical protein